MAAGADQAAAALDSKAARVLQFQVGDMVWVVALPVGQHWMGVLAAVAGLPGLPVLLRLPVWLCWVGWLAGWLC